MTEQDAGDRRTGELLAIAEDRGTIGSWSWQAGSDRVDWSAGLYKLAGLPRSEAGPTLEACRRLIHPDDLREIVDWRELLKMERIDDRVFRIIRPDGKVRRVRLHGRTLRVATAVCSGRAASAWM